MKHYCDDVLDEEDRRAVQMHRRSHEVIDIKYFIGMPCLDSSGDLCFICAWDVVHNIDFSSAPSLVSDRLERESYYLFKLDGTGQVINLPKGNFLSTTTFTEADVHLLLEKTEVARYFSGVQLPKDHTKGVEHRDGRGRLLLSPHTMSEYPEDDQAGDSWVNHGFGNDQREPFEESIRDISST